MSHFKKSCAIPMYMTNDGWRFVLVKSTSGNWIFPKGSVKKQETLFEAAKREAYEESGACCFLHGVRTVEPYGAYTYRVNGKPKCVAVFVIICHSMTDDYPEADKRERILVDCKEARRLIKREAVRRILKTIHKHTKKGIVK